jgi:ribosomal-protein-alanine N-acetyltransferase
MSALLRPASEAYVPMTSADLDDVARVEGQIYPFPWTLGNFADSLRSGYSCWVLRGKGGGLQAYAIVMVALDEAHLLNLSVAAEFQRSGLGWRTLEWVAQVARGHGARTLLLEVRPSNPAAIRLYDRYGFQHIGVRRGYYPAADGREDALVMRVTL